MRTGDLTKSGFTAYEQPILKTYTSEEVALGIDINDNEEITITGNVNEFIINSAIGASIITFIAGAIVDITIPVGNGFAGGYPVFEENKVYNVTYYKGTWYADGGR